MKKILFFVLISFLSFSNIASALTLTKAPESQEIKDTSLKINWEKVTGALGYYVYYGKDSIEGKTKEEKAYQSQLPDFIESTGAIIPDLEANTKYYVAVTAVDENGEEGPYSVEATFSTISSQGVNSRLGLTQVNVIGENQVKLSFNVDLDNSSNAVREFKIIEESTQKELVIKTVDLVGTKNLLLTFEQKLSSTTRYKLTILSLLDKTGKNIEQGIDGLSSFTTPATFTLPNETASGANLNSALPVVNLSNNGNAGQNISQDNTTLNSAAETSNLPKTGPEHIFLFILALIVGFFVFHFQRKKMEDLK